MMDLLGKILLSIFLGAFIGTERERHKEKKGAGVRTESFVCLFGALTAFVALQYEMPAAIFAGLFITGAFAVALYWHKAKSRKQAGMTTSVAIMLTYFIGVLVSMEFFREAIALSVIIFLLLFSKERMAGKIRQLTEKEILNAVEFAIIAFVIYPFLPDYALLGVNIREVWGIVLVVSAVSFAGFLAMRHYGYRKGLLISSFFGSMLSSTAVVASNIRNYKKNKRLLNLFVLSSALAFAVMAIRNMLVASFLAADMAAGMAFAKLIGVSAAYIAFVYFLLRKAPGKRIVHRLDSPFAIKPALYFGIIFFAILAFSRMAISYFGPAAVIPISIVGGMGSGYAITASLALLFSQGTISASVLAVSVIAASIAGMLADTATVYAFRQARLANKMLILVSVFAFLLLGALLVA